MLNEMKYVYEVYKEKSFSKAAKKLFISQPALSNMVRKAEKEMGAPIFDRSTIPLTVTKEGAYYTSVPLKRFFFWNGIWNGIFKILRGFRAARWRSAVHLISARLCIRI